MNCTRCGRPLDGKQKRWCSLRCSKLGLKAEYKKRNHEKVKAYGRDYKKRHGHIHNSETVSFVFPGRFCYFCKKMESLHIHHLSYEKHEVVYLCSSCHIKYHTLVKHQEFVKTVVFEKKEI